MAYGVCHHQFDVKTVTQSSPSPVISLVHTLPYGAEPLLHSDTGSSASPSTSSGNEQEASKALKDVHLPTRLMDMFLDLASGNTSKDLETCGVLGASLKKGTFYVTTLIIPKQESESNSCQALHEEEIFSIQNQQGLFPIGWIHTHPSQSCFMSSIDLHTQYSYQVMVPEAVGIVMAPTDKSRDYGIFRLSNGGMRILKDCSEKGFHPHREPADGSSIYEDCSNVYVNQNLRLEICMLNKWSKKDQKSSRGDRSIHRRPALEQKMRVGMVQVVPQRRQQGQVLLNLAVKWSLLLVAYAVVICGRLSGQHCCSAISCPMWMDHLQFICAQDAFRLCLSTLLLNAKTWEVPLMPF